MVDILANIWLNIDSFSYPKLYNIDARDLETLNTVRFNIIFYPTTTFLICFGLSRNREKIFNLVKKHFLNREKNFKLDLENYKMKDITKEELSIETINISKKKINMFSTKGDDISIFEPRKVVNNRVPYQPQVIKDPKRNVDMFTEEYAGWLKSYKNSAKEGLSPFRMMFKNRLDNKEKLSVRINKFLFTTKLIYLPFLIMLIVCFKDLYMTYFGFYCKYQPLIDRYNEHLTKEKAKNKL